MRRLYVVSFLLLFAFSAAIAAVKGPAPEELTPTTTLQETAARSDVPTDRPGAPMLAEITSLVNARQAEVAELNERAIHADFRTRIELQHRIRAIKQQTQLDILGIQVEYARRAGRIEAAERLEAQIEAVKNPVIPTRTIERDPRTHLRIDDQGGGQ
jgi:hypothetical protein